MDLTSPSYFYNAVQAMVGNKMAMFSAIEHDGEILLILQAEKDDARKVWRPILVLPLSKVKHQDYSDDPKAPMRWFLNDPLPTSLFDGTASRAEWRRYGARKAPPLKFNLMQVH
jgi:hypothetical protein